MCHYTLIPDVSDGRVLACRLRAVTWLQPQVERIWSFLCIALMCLITQNPKWESHIQVWWRSATGIFCCLVLCCALGPSKYVFGLHGRYKQVSTVSFQIVLSTQAVFGSFQLHGPKYSVISVREEESCYRLTPWPLPCFVSCSQRAERKLCCLKNSLYEAENLPIHASWLHVSFWGREVSFCLLMTCSVMLNMGYLCPSGTRTLLYLQLLFLPLIL